MARYRGPVEKIERRLGVSLDLKGERRLSGKSSLTRRPYGPGQHGQRRTKLSEYGIRLREKQKVKFMYGVSEKQFRAIFQDASRMKGNTGENLLVLFERRLDNVVYRLGFATTRSAARQLVSHGHILVDGKKLDIPSYRVKPGQTIELKEKTKSNDHVVRAIQLTAQTGFMPWIEVDGDKGKGVFTRFPEREEINIPVEERLIVEYYSR